jgi:hypothetical protein
MRGRFVLERPDDLEATIKITATVKEWVQLQEQLANSWPSFRLSEIIADVITQARKVFYAAEEDSPHA